MVTDAGASVMQNPINISQLRLPLPIECPCLSRHQVYRPLEHHDPASSNDINEENRRLFDNIDAVNSFVYNNISEKTDVKLFNGGIRTFDNAKFRVSTKETLHFILDTKDSPLIAKCIVQFHTEAVCVGIHLFIRERMPELEAICNEKPLSNSVPGHESAQFAKKYMLDLVENGQADPIGGSMQNHEATARQDALFSKVWDAIDCGIKERLESSNSELIADFRGIILHSLPASDLYRMESEAIQQRKDGFVIGKRKIEWADFRQRQDSSTFDQIFKQNRDYVSRRSDFFGKILSCGNASDGPKPPRAGNTVYCGFMDGLAVYGSSLQSPIVSISPNMVRYFLVFGGHSKHQLGRLNLRLCRAGTARVLSMLDHSDVRNASKAMRRAGLRLDTAKFPNLNPKTFAQGLESFSKVVEQAQASFKDEIKHAGRGGFKFRMSRIADYGEQLRSILVELRAVRIPGWQTYPDFVQRHILSEVHNLGTIERRAENLELRFQRMHGQQVSGALNNYASESAKLMKTLDKNTKSSTDLNQQILDVQKTAEIFVVLGGCYYAYVLTKDWIEKWPKFSIFEISETLVNNVGDVLPFLFIAIAFSFVVYFNFFRRSTSGPGGGATGDAPTDATSAEAPAQTAVSLPEGNKQ